MSDLDTILKRLVADIDDAMEMQGTRWSSNERVAGLVQEALEQATRLIQVLYATEMSSLDQEIVSLKAKQPPVESLDSILAKFGLAFHKAMPSSVGGHREIRAASKQIRSLIQTSNREARVDEVANAETLSGNCGCPACDYLNSRLQTLTKEEE